MDWDPIRFKGGRGFSFARCTGYNIFKPYVSPVARDYSDCDCDCGHPGDDGNDDGSYCPLFIYSAGTERFVQHTALHQIWTF